MMQLRKILYYLIVIACAVYVVIIHAQLYADVIYVYQNSEFHSIQTALDSCSDGDTVIVGPGVYSENITWPQTKGIHLLSDLGPVHTTIQAAIDSSVISMLTKVDSSTVIQGFTIRNGNATNGGGILCVRASPVIRDNVIIQNFASSNGAGVYCVQSRAIIQKNIIRCNNASFCGGGVYAGNLSLVKIRDNTISQNNALQGGGVMIHHSTAAVYRNNISNNTGGIYFHNARGTIDSCTISYNNGYGIYNVSYKKNLPVPSVHFCNIFDNTDYEIFNNHSYMTRMSATNNWWGTPAGPNTGLIHGKNDVAGSVDCSMWLSESVRGVDDEYECGCMGKQISTAISKEQMRQLYTDVLRVYDISGREVSKDNIKSGIYFLQMSSGEINRVIIFR
jgi:hypothetical protein